MKTYKFLTHFFVICMIALTGLTYSQVSTVKTKIKKQNFPQFSIAPSGGAIFPLTRDFRADFKPGGVVGMDIGLKLNKEVGIYGKFNYMFMSSKKTGAPIGQYMEFSAGPRYFFTHPKLKSQVYFEGGAGAYYFNQNSYVDPIDNTLTVSQVSQTNAGINGGVGASLFLSDAVSILAKAKYHNVFTRTGSVGFMTVNAGLEFTI
ncbi:MAG TPA: outer membrane beta-barrel protein, partial [Ignavibacteria bacterium]|nr:outer membrane beta-barrel protein [Ignavibacteria bacterium]